MLFRKHTKKKTHWGSGKAPRELHSPARHRREGRGTLNSIHLSGIKICLLQIRFERPAEEAGGAWGRANADATRNLTRTSSNRWLDLLSSSLSSLDTLSAWVRPCLWSRLRMLKRVLLFLPCPFSLGCSMASLFEPSPKLWAGSSPGDAIVANASATFCYTENRTVKLFFYLLLPVGGVYPGSMLLLPLWHHKGGDICIYDRCFLPQQTCWASSWRSRRPSGGALGHPSARMLGRFRPRRPPIGRWRQSFHGGPTSTPKTRRDQDGASPKTKESLSSLRPASNDCCYYPVKMLLLGLVSVIIVPWYWGGVGAASSCCSRCLFPGPVPPPYTAAHRSELLFAANHKKQNHKNRDCLL